MPDYVIACPECGAPYDTAAIVTDDDNLDPTDGRTLVLGCTRCVTLATMPLPAQAQLFPFDGPESCDDGGCWT